MATTVEDAAGREVATLDARTLSLGYGQGAGFAVAWNTGRTYAGSYAFRVRVSDATNPDQVRAQATVPVLAAEEPEKPASIFLNVPAAWSPSAAQPLLTIEGQLKNSEGRLARGTQSIFVFVSHGRAPALVLSYNGLFRFAYHPAAEPGAVKLTLQCGAAELQHTLDVGASIHQDHPTGAVKPQPLNGAAYALALDFALLHADDGVAYGELRASASALRAASAPLNGTEIHLRASRGEIFPRAFLENGAVRVPLSYLVSEREVVLEAEVSGEPPLKARLVLSGNLPAPPAQNAAAPAAVPEFAWDFRYTPSAPGRQGVLLNLKILHGAPPTPLVKFKALLGRFPEGAVASWLGDEASVVYTPPESGASDTFTAYSGRLVARLQHPLYELRSNEPAASVTDALPPGEENLRLELLDGQTRLSAGGQDRTRLKFRIADLRDNAVPDGTEVEFSCPQAQVSPERAKSRHGVVSITLLSTDWVGTYPLVVKVGRMRSSFDLTFTVPSATGRELPGLPRGPAFRLPGPPPPPQ